MKKKKIIAREKLIRKKFLIEYLFKEASSKLLMYLNVYLLEPNGMNLFIVSKTELNVASPH